MKGEQLQMGPSGFNRQRKSNAPQQKRVHYLQNKAFTTDWILQQNTWQSLHLILDVFMARTGSFDLIEEWCKHL